MSHHPMHIHILGVCGTFMAGVAVLAKQLGYQVSGMDEQVYPPMSDQLREAGITLIAGYDPAQIPSGVTDFVVGNVVKRGNPSLEALLNQQMPFMSGPEWLAKHVLARKTVLAVSGTHGKTTTSSLLAWILEVGGLNPGFLIGGVPQNFGVSARVTDSPYFVIEADEYDSAFFDKRSKFIHYRPSVLIINNLEFDHADIFPNLAAIQQQFHHLVRTVKGEGAIVFPADDQAVLDVLAMGCWTPRLSFGMNNGAWQARLIKADGSQFKIMHNDAEVGEVQWSLLGNHNVLNALAAIAAAQQVQVPVAKAIAALASFQNVKRRLEVRGQAAGVTVYDDFAHHPTAISTTMAGLRARVGKQRVIALLELGSYTMRTGHHQATIADALSDADEVHILLPKNATWDVTKTFAGLKMPHQIYDSVEAMVAQLPTRLRSGDHVLVMSNSHFGDIHTKLLAAVNSKMTNFS